MNKRVNVQGNKTHNNIIGKEKTDGSRTVRNVIHSALPPQKPPVKK